MNLSTTTYAYALIAVISFGISTGCKKDSKILTRMIGKIGGGSEKQTGKLELTLAEQMTEDIVIALKEKSGLNEEQANSIRTGALNGITTGSSLSLASVDGNDLSLAAPHVMQGAIKAMASPGAGLGDDDKKVAAAGTITGALFKSLKTKINRVSGDQKKNLAGSITKAALSSLDDGGVSADAIANGVGKVMGETVSNLDDAGYSKDELKEVFTKVTKSSIEGLKEAGISSKNANKSLKSLMKSSVGSLDEAGIDTASMGDFVGPILTSAVSDLGTLGFKPSQVGSVMDDLMEGAVGALGEAGLKTSGDVKNVMDKCIHGAMAGMSSAGVGKEHFADTMESMMTGAIGSLDAIGIKDAQSIKDVSGDVIKKAVSYVDDFGISDASVIKKASLKLAQGTMKALGNMKNKGILSDSDATGLAAEVQKKGVAALKEQNDKFGFSDKSGSGLAALFSEGIRQGLAQAKFSATAITGMSDAIATAGREGLVEANVDPAVAEQAATLTKTSITAWVNEMEIHCKEDKGIWHTDGGGWCEFPLTEPVAGAVGPTLEQEDKCFNSGGFIMFKSDGSWFCDSYGTLAGMGTQAECEAQGYFWVRDLEGIAYCETVAPTGTCYQKTTQTTCQSASGCVWMTSFCQESSLLTCGSYFTSDNCSKATGCIWNTTQGFCENATIVKCSATTSADCSGQPGCVWNNGCVASATIDCPSQSTESSCNQTSGCGWDGTYCINLQNLSCGSYGTATTCKATTGCIWDNTGLFCLNSAAISCDQFTSETACSPEPGCLWSNSKCINSSNLDCPGQTSSTSCNSMTGCIWDSQDLLCRNAATISCGAQVTQSTCQAEPGCLWDSIENICINSASISCEGMLQTDCGNEPGCLWDTTNNHCKNAAFIDCSANTDSTTCSNAAGCAWDGFSCLAAVNLDCGQKTNQTDCNSLASCFWDPQFNACANASLQDCGQYNSSQANCTSDPACHWNSSASQCEALTGSSCSYYADSTSCNASSEGCSWDTSLNACHFPTSSGQCHTNADQATCELDQMCVWNTDHCSTDNNQYCALSYTTTATCDADPYCSWSGSTCAWSGPPECNGIADQTSCNGQTPAGICYWDSKDNRCRDDRSLICSQYLSGSSADCSTEATCSWNGSTCQYIGLATCGLYHDNQTSCDSFSECLWSSSNASCTQDNQARCNFHTSDLSCQMEYECAWDGTTCNYTGPVDCYLFGSDQTTCQNADLGVCQWNATNSSCFTDQQAQCQTYNTDQASCDSSWMSCSWDGTTCNYSGPVDCNNYSDQTSCDAIAPGICSWSNTYCSTNQQAFCQTYYTDQSSCDGSYMMCGWDGTTCNYTGPVSCSPLDQSTCTAQQGCYWKSANSQCELEGVGYCAYWTDQSQCDSKSECSWNGTSCDYSGPTICGSITNQTSCDGDAVCAWNTSGSYCEPDPIPYCSSLTDSSSCTNTGGQCQWDGTNCAFSDHESPDITAVVMDNTAYTSGQSALITVTATDNSGIDLSAMATECWELRSDTTSTTVFACNPLTDNGNGTFTMSMPINSYTQTGTYYLSKVGLKDLGSNNQTRMLQSSSVGQTYYSNTTDPDTITVPQATITNNGSTDATAPATPTAMTATCSSSDATTSPSCTIDFTVTDTGGSGIKLVTDSWWEFTSDTGNMHTFSVQPYISDLGSDNYRINFTLSQYVEIANYRLTQWAIKDNAGNMTQGSWTTGTYYDSPHQALLVPSLSISAANTDIHPPVISAGPTFDAASYTAGTTGAYITFDLTDQDSSGITTWNPCYMVEKTDQTFNFHICQDFHNVTGNTYQYGFDVPANAPQGTYYLKELRFYDAAQNYREYIAPDATGTGNYTVFPTWDTPPPAPGVITFTIP